MRLVTNSDGIKGLIPTGYPFPVLLKSNGSIVVPVAIYMMNHVATNAWKSRETTLTNAKRFLDIFAYFEDNGISFDDVRVTNLTQYRNFKMRVGIAGVPASLRVVNAVLELFKRYWAWAVKEQFVRDSTPISLSDYDVRTSGLPAFADKILPTTADIKHFCSVLRGPEELIATGLAFGAGLRRAEIVGLPADIILPLDRVERRRGAVLLVLDGHHTPTKGSKPRTVEIPIRLYGEMLNYKMSDRRESRLERSAAGAHTLLVSKYGQPLQPDWVNDFFARGNQLSGLALHVHLLRHWYATRFLEYETPGRFNGDQLAALKALKRRLGHAYLETTNGYTHFAVNDESEKVRAITAYQRQLDEMLKDLV